MVQLLIVDDSEDLVQMMGRLVKGHSTRVITASDGLMAYEVLQSTPVDLLITDMDMPRWNGLRLIQEVRKNRGSLPVIAMSANADYREHLSELNVEHFFEKPFKKNEVLNVLDNIFQRHQWEIEGKQGQGMKDAVSGDSGLSLNTGPLNISETQLLQIRKVLEEGLLIIPEGQFFLNKISGSFLKSLITVNVPIPDWMRVLPILKKTSFCHLVEKGREVFYTSQPREIPVYKDKLMTRLFGRSYFGAPVVLSKDEALVFCVYFDGELNAESQKAFLDLLAKIRKIVS